VWESYRYDLNKGNTSQFNSLSGVVPLCGKAIDMTLIKVIHYNLTAYPG